MCILESQAATERNCHCLNEAALPGLCCGNGKQKQGQKANRKEGVRFPLHSFPSGLCQAG